MRTLNKGKRSAQYFCIIVLLIISSVFTFNLTSSRYTGELQSSDMEIAKPILDLNYTSDEFKIDNMLPTEENPREYSFSVSNNTSDENNEIPLEYYIKVNLQTEIPLKVSLFDTTSGESAVQLDANNKTAEKIQLPSVNENGKITRNYKLKIEWDKSKENYNNYMYANQPITCKVELVAEQK